MQCAINFLDTRQKSCNILGAHPDAEACRIYYRFLETDDEYIDPPAGHHPRDRWKTCWLYVPDDVLEKINNKNARQYCLCSRNGIETRISKTIVPNFLERIQFKHRNK